MSEQESSPDQISDNGRFPDQFGMTADEAAQARGISTEHLQTYDVHDLQASDAALHNMGVDMLRASDTRLDKAWNRFAQATGLRNEGGGRGRITAPVEEIMLRRKAEEAADAHISEFTGTEIDRSSVKHQARSSGASAEQEEKPHTKEASWRRGLKRRIGALALTGLAVAGSIGLFGSKGSEQEPVNRKEVATSVRSSEITGEIRVQDTPFEAEVPDEVFKIFKKEAKEKAPEGSAIDTKYLEERVRDYEYTTGAAEENLKYKEFSLDFLKAIKTSSGLKFNIYMNTDILPGWQENVDFSAYEFDKAIQTTIEVANLIYPNDKLEQFIQEAKAGKFNANPITVLVSGSQEICVDEDHNDFEEARVIEDKESGKVFSNHYCRSGLAGFADPEMRGMDRESRANYFGAMLHIKSEALDGKDADMPVIAVSLGSGWHKSEVFTHEFGHYLSDRAGLFRDSSGNFIGDEEHRLLVNDLGYLVGEIMYRKLDKGNPVKDIRRFVDKYMAEKYEPETEEPATKLPSAPPKPETTIPTAPPSESKIPATNG